MAEETPEESRRSSGISVSGGTRHADCCFDLGCRVGGQPDRANDCLAERCSALGRGRKGAFSTRLREIEHRYSEPTLSFDGARFPRSHLVGLPAVHQFLSFAETRLIIEIHSVFPVSANQPMNDS
jgi:hypothetical protein